jgi:hypothetical protein
MAILAVIAITTATSAARILPARLWRRVAILAAERAGALFVGPGETLFPAGDPCTGCYWLIERC